MNLSVFVHQVPPGISNLTQTLTLCHNNFQRLPDFTQVVLPNLRALCFTNNNISDIDPYTFKWTRNLLTFSLAHNQLTDFNRAGLPIIYRCIFQKLSDCAFFIIIMVARTLCDPKIKKMSINK